MSIRLEIVELNNRGTWDVWHQGELIVEATTTPLCDAARILLARGMSPISSWKQFDAVRIGSTCGLRSEMPPS